MRGRKRRMQKEQQQGLQEMGQSINRIAKRSLDLLLARDNQLS
jgi:hypothetical protein